MGTFTKEHRDIRTIFIMGADNLTPYEHLRSYDGYVVTNSMIDMEQSYFESQIDISKMDFYKTFVYYYNEKVDREELEQLKQSEDSEEYPHGADHSKAVCLQKPGGCRRRDGAVFDQQQRHPGAHDLLQELGEKYAKKLDGVHKNSNPPWWRKRSA